jgi:hypothetical protein
MLIIANIGNGKVSKIEILIETHLYFFRRIKTSLPFDRFVNFEFLSCPTTNYSPGKNSLHAKLFSNHVSDKLIIQILSFFILSCGQFGNVPYEV